MDNAAFTRKVPAVEETEDPAPDMAILLLNIKSPEVCSMIEEVLVTGNVEKLVSPATLRVEPLIARDPDETVAPLWIFMVESVRSRIADNDGLVAAMVKVLSSKDNVLPAALMVPPFQFNALANVNSIFVLKVKLPESISIVPLSSGVTSLKSAEPP